MKRLDLTNVNKSEIKYTITYFPDGQRDVTVHGLTDTVDTQWGKIHNSSKERIVTIASRFNSFRDLEIIICTVKALRRLGMREIHLYIPYLLGSRSDRQFQEGGTSYLVDVIAPILNSLNFETVTVLDVHNPVMTAACINNLYVMDNIQLVEQSINKTILPLDINNLKGWEKTGYATYETTKDYLNNVCLVSPDEGALKKIYNVAKAIGYKEDVIVCSKIRDITTGKIVATDVPSRIYNDDSYENKEFIIIDDICDGGRTFIEIAKKIKEMRQDSKIHLIITHGIFSAGLKDLSEYFTTISTTNSIMDINSSTEFGMHNEKYLNKVTQINVF
jgi:ribose-phosphate pyrophosphokinase